MSGFGVLLMIAALMWGSGWWFLSEITGAMHKMLQGPNKLRSLSSRTRADSIMLGLRVKFAILDSSLCVYCIKSIIC